MKNEEAKILPAAHAKMIFSFFILHSSFPA